ncbi:DUF421 domain-containing protein [Polluticaenibacter yanchengensis]|uniref:DUF421 domain-containing protein n=1 Tax=Polluticaenibacter yanchengensis TaxID=3014562 RepID=A0ABT4UFD7_9BACT|nr:DUF421 domain-containing protein [Chitinophagaceae bacterium LY-5]
MDMLKMLFEGADKNFIIEIIGRTIFMFFLILLILRLSGRRGVRQLTLFEVAIILGLGSAAGDPMFQEEIPVIYSIIVLFSVIVLYKIITFLASKSELVTRIFEGREMVVVENGEFKIDGNKDSDFSQKEFFAELRNKSIEHLGQVRLAVLEIDGTLSILKYPTENIKYGLPLFPGSYKPILSIHEKGPFACMFCGSIQHKLSHKNQTCDNCGKKEWTIAIKTPFIH